MAGPFLPQLIPNTPPPPAPGSPVAQLIENIFNPQGTAQTTPLAQPPPVVFQPLQNIPGVSQAEQQAAEARRQGLLTGIAGKKVPRQSQRPTRTTQQRIGDLIVGLHDLPGNLMRGTGNVAEAVGDTVSENIQKLDEALTALAEETQIGDTGQFAGAFEAQAGERARAKVEAPTVPEVPPEAAPEVTSQARQSRRTAGGAKKPPNAGVLPSVPPLASTESASNRLTEGMKLEALMSQLDALAPEKVPVEGEFRSLLGGAIQGLLQSGAEDLGTGLLAIAAGGRAGLEGRKAQIAANRDAQRQAALEKLLARLEFEQNREENAITRLGIQAGNEQQRRALEFGLFEAERRNQTLLDQARIQAQSSQSGLSALNSILAAGSRQVNQGNNLLVLKHLGRDPAGRKAIVNAAAVLKIPLGEAGGPTPTELQAGELIDALLQDEESAALIPNAIARARLEAELMGLTRSF